MPTPAFVYANHTIRYVRRMDKPPPIIIASLFARDKKLYEYKSVHFPYLPERNWYPYLLYELYVLAQYMVKQWPKYRIVHRIFIIYDHHSAITREIPVTSWGLTVKSRNWSQVMRKLYLLAVEFRVKTMNMQFFREISILDIFR